MECIGELECMDSVRILWDWARIAYRVQNCCEASTGKVWEREEGMVCSSWIPKHCNLYCPKGCSLCEPFGNFFPWLVPRLVHNYTHKLVFCITQTGIHIMYTKILFTQCIITNLRAINMFIFSNPYFLWYYFYYELVVASLPWKWDRSGKVDCEVTPTCLYALSILLLAISTS